MAESIEARCRDQRGSSRSQCSTCRDGGSAVDSLPGNSGGPCPRQYGGSACRNLSRYASSSSGGYVAGRNRRLPERSDGFPELNRQPEYGARRRVFIFPRTGRLRQPRRGYRAGYRHIASEDSPRRRCQMTGRERNLLLTGLLIGALAAGALFVARQYIPAREEPTAAADDPAVDRSTSEASATKDEDGAAAVQLTDQE